MTQQSADQHAKYLYQFVQVCILEVLLNSMSSVLSYNNFDFGPIFLRKDKRGDHIKKEEMHQPTFVKQMFYFIFFLILNLGFDNNMMAYSLSVYFIFRLTISTEMTMMSMETVKLVDTNGNLHFLTKFQVKIEY